MNTQTTAQNGGADALAARLDKIEAQLGFLVEQKQRQQELFSEMTPILRQVMATATQEMDEMEKEGLFAFGREMLIVARKVVQHYSPEDVRLFGDAVVKILDTVRAMTQPEVLLIADQASAVLQKADEAEPIGIFGMVRASRNDDVQKGMAVMLDLLKNVGQAAKAMATARAAHAPANRREKLSDRLGPSKTKRALGTERTKPAAAPRRAPPAAAAPRADLGPPAACAVPSGQKPVAAVMDGIGFTADGHLADPKQWSADLATNLAAAQGLSLEEGHWKLITFARSDFESTGVSPNVRRLTQGTGLATKDIYGLFPQAPARTIAKIAGIPKPAGCI